MTSGLVELGEAECLALAGTVAVGRLVHTHDGVISVLPVNPQVSGRSALVRTAAGSELLAAARAGAAAVLELDDLVDWSRSGWSVLLRGRLGVVDGPVPDPGPDPWAGGERVHGVRLDVEQVSGRRIVPGPGGVSTVWL